MRFTLCHIIIGGSIMLGTQSRKAMAANTKHHKFSDLSERVDRIMMEIRLKPKWSELLPVRISVALIIATTALYLLLQVLSMSTYAQPLGIGNNTVPAPMLSVIPKKSKILVGGSSDLSKTVLYISVIGADKVGVPNVTVSLVTSRGHVASSVTTDAKGSAQTELISGNYVGDAKVEATATLSSAIELSDSATVIFGTATAKVKFLSESEQSNLTRVPCVVTVEFDGEAVPNRNIQLVLKLSHDTEGATPIVGMESYAWLDDSTGTTNANGLFQTHLNWVPSSSWPNPYFVGVDAYDGDANYDPE